MTSQTTAKEGLEDSNTKIEQSSTTNKDLFEDIKSTSAIDSANMSTKSTPSVTLRTATNSTISSTTSANSSSSSKSRTQAPAMSVFRSIAKQTFSIGRQLAKVSSKSASKIGPERKPDMSKMRQVTPIYDHNLKRWVFPEPPKVHRDEPRSKGSACKQFPLTSAESSRRSSR